MLRNRCHLRAGFSLVEVAMSVAITMVGFASILGLLSVGLDHFRTAIDNTVCGQIAQRVINDAQQTDFRVLVDEETTGGRVDPGFSFRAPRVDAPALRYFDEQGNEVVPRSSQGVLDVREKEAVIYQVNTRVRPNGEVPRAAGAVVTQLAQVTVQVARCPGTLKLEFYEAGPKVANLFQPRPGIPILHYSALIGRNE